LVDNERKGRTVMGGGRIEQVQAFDESVRTLRDSILLSDPGRRPRSLLMTSATPREGKTTTAIHLAVAHSMQKRRTLLIDADLRRPSVHDRLSVPNDCGLSTVVEGNADWRTVLQKPSAYPYLDVLPAGPASRRAADCLGTTLQTLLSDA